MELLLYFFLPLLWLGSLVAMAIYFVILVFKAARHKDTQRTKKALLTATICMVVSFVLVGVGTQKLGKTSSANSNINDVSSATESENAASSVLSESESELVSDEVELGTDKEHPYILTAEQLASEIEQDIDAAKEKYNDKWVQITGEITDMSDFGRKVDGQSATTTDNGWTMCGYYIYGQRSTTGYTGLRIICWCNDVPYSEDPMGDTCTFLGQLREVTTVNATEIGDCIILP